MRLLPVILCGLSWGSLASSAKLEDLFTLKQGQGNEVCQQLQVNLIRTWLQDITKLTATIGIALNGDGLDSNLIMLEHLKSFLGITYTVKDGKGTINKDDGSQGKLDQVKELFGLVENFLSQEIKSLASNKPRLYCDSTWLVELSQVFDEDGHPETYVDSSGKTQNVDARKTSPDAVSNQGLKDDLKAWQEKDAQGNYKLYPYWAADFNQVFEEDAGHQYNGNPPSFCNGFESLPKDEDSEGRFMDFDNGVTVVTICPAVFKAVTYLISFDSVLNAQDVKTEGKALQDVVPMTVVLFHELFHLVDYSNTKDVAYGVENCLQARRDGKKVETNPDSLAYFAFAYFLSTAGNANPRYDWSSGISVPLIKG